ncbi:MAG: uroporphyrinogen-III C-methyltransferase [Phycisphaerales bacterium]|nr:uroporphyrinogen-III C-methyltransferase [Phycisphaerales bacterium]
MLVTDSRKKGFVALVGAGPGDVGLLTVRGRELLERADVVVYDYLANVRLLQFAPEQAEKIYAGKKAASHSMTQEQINQLLVQRGRAGQRVVRLKGGDPFVFGRGGEECEALSAAGIRFEVVPGITAALAAPAYAGIPVTHRDLNSSFTFITGHEKEQVYKSTEALARTPGEGSSDIDWPSIAKLPCIAFYMGVKSLPRIVSQLIDNGMCATTPAAVIQWGTHPRQRTVVATLANLVGEVEKHKLSAPAITIIGQVVALRKNLNWFETRPLFGRCIAVTRTRHQASELTRRLEELGAQVIEAPTIELHPPVDPDRVHQALIKAARGDYDWVVLTSANSVTQVRRALQQWQLDARIFSSCRIAAIGAATNQALEQELCLRADFVPSRAVAESLADELPAHGKISGGRFSLLRADIGRPLLVQRLMQQGAAVVDDVAVYQTRTTESLPEELIEALEHKRVDWITFTSSSCVKNLVSLLGDRYNEKLQGVHLASIGPITSTALREAGLQLTVEARSPDLDCLVEAINEFSAASVAKEGAV